MTNESISICPISGKRCDIHQWTTDHINNQYVAPGIIRRELVAPIVAIAVECDGVAEDCQPVPPQELEEIIEQFQTANG